MPGKQTKSGCTSSGGCFVVMWSLIVLPFQSHLFPYLFLRFQTRLEEHEAGLRCQFEDRERELVELNQLTARRLTETESKLAALQASKLIPEL